MWNGGGAGKMCLDLKQFLLVPGILIVLHMIMLTGKIECVVFIDLWNPGNRGLNSVLDLLGNNFSSQCLPLFKWCL